MSEHDHREYVEGCFRCDLSSEEVITSPIRIALAAAWEAGYTRGTIGRPAENPYSREAGK